MENIIKKRVYALYRVSTKGQVDINENDIPMQRDSCREFVDSHPGWELTREFKELGVSGFKVSAKDRDQIQEIQEDALRGLFDILLVFMFDRLGRRDDETPFVVEWFVKQGVEVWSVKEGQQRFDNHVDKLLNYLRYWQASGESIKTSVRVKTRMEQLTEEGYFTGGTVPYGYQLVNKGRKNKKDKEVYDIEIVPAEAAVVKEIFFKYVNEGFGAQRISKYLSSVGVKGRKGKNIPNTSIINILKNETYIGFIHNGNAKSKKKPELVIIDDDTFMRAQELIKQRTNKHSDVPLNLKGSALLSGKVYCGHCRNRLTLTTSSGSYSRIDRARKFIRARYCCHYRVRHPDECDGQAGYGVKTLDEMVEVIIKLQFAKIKAKAGSDVIAKQQAREIDFASARYESAKKQALEKKKNLQDLKAEMLKIIQGESKFNVDMLNELIEENSAQLKEAEENMLAAQAELEGLQDTLKRVEQEYEQLLSWADAYEQCSFDARKMIIAQFVKAVYVHKGYELEIEFNVSFEELQRFGGADKNNAGGEVKSLQSPA